MSWAIGGTFIQRGITTAIRTLGGAGSANIDIAAAAVGAPFFSGDGAANIDFSVDGISNSFFSAAGEANIDFTADAGVTDTLFAHVQTHRWMDSGARQWLNRTSQLENRQALVLHAPAFDPGATQGRAEIDISVSGVGAPIFSAAGAANIDIAVAGASFDEDVLTDLGLNELTDLDSDQLTEGT
jgi:hypothetical protein